MAAGVQVRGHKALAKGLVDEYADDVEDLMSRAKA